ncbi:alpha/beta hydrolase [Flaviflexus salsibiostraticola]|uniref:Alpha/beta hydrolase n=1 Tax=Flaviflexus salsibiostraticola TaxID=1282737 RepID=A0A3Q8WUC0_9ACTO|nr:alpha/beta hydrolase [Flaviflexus salsibiostraticola]AZN30460.1 alpha/beta hydrolase [Flaviflexus salsibiostraticola]
MKRTLAALASLALLLGACSSTAEETASDTADSPVPTQPAPAGLEEFYNQSLEWGECMDGTSAEAECAKVRVPLDYEDPSEATIDIAVLRIPAGGEAQGSLVVNPGGPGASGMDMADSAGAYFSRDLVESYDIIGFDPRGVGESAPVDCLPDEELGDLLDRAYPDTPEGEAEALRDTKTIISSCTKASGHLLEHLSTINTARDMDIMRAALGEPHLDYLGFSYGTHLGGQYADLFPENVGRMVLDGAIDPAISSLDSSYFQAVGFEKALEAYLEYCLEDEDCPLEAGTVDEAKAHLQSEIEASLESPIPTSIDDRSVNPAIFYTGIATTLYSEDTWPFLTEALRMAIEDGDGTLLLTFNDLMLGRDTFSGEFMDNSLEARWAINCRDFPAETNAAAVEANDARLNEDAPTFAPFFEGGDIFCAGWPYTADEVPGPFVAEGSNPIVVIGTEGDPATPYEASVNLAEQLENGILVTWEGEGHTAYGTAGECIDDAVDRYFIDGELPEDGLRCPA